MSGTRRNGGIEALRVLFSFAIIGLHGGWNCRGGYLGVEFFFMITGLFLAKKLSEERGNISLSIACKESRQYLAKRIEAIYPYFLASTFIGIFVKFFCGSISTQHLPSIAGDILLLQNFGFPVISGTGVVWYLCADFFALWLIYPLGRKNYELYVKYVAPINVIVILGFILRNYGSLEVPDSYYGVINVGLLRGISGISMGMIAYELTKSFPSKPIRSKTWYYLGSIIEILLLLIIFGYMIIMDKPAKIYDGYVCFLIITLIVITYSQSTLISRLSDNKLTRMGGQISATIFMNHFYWFNDFRYKFLTPNINSELLERIICFFLSIVTSIFVKTVIGKMMSKTKK